MPGEEVACIVGGEGARMEAAVAALLQEGGDSGADHIDCKVALLEGRSR